MCNQMLGMNTAAPGGMRYLFALCLGLTAAGAQADKTTDAYFRSLDLNGDGFVSLSEAAGDEVVVSRFDRADKNRDGKLSRAEYDDLGSAPADKANAKSRAKAKARAKAKTPKAETR